MSMRKLERILGEKLERLDASFVEPPQPTFAEELVDSLRAEQAQEVCDELWRMGVMPSELELQRSSSWRISMSMKFVAWLNELRAKFTAQEQKIEDLTERVKALEQAEIRRPAVVLSGKRNG